MLIKPADNQSTTTFVAANVESDFKDTHHAVAVLPIVDAKADLAMAAGLRKPKVSNPVRLS